MKKYVFGTAQLGTPQVASDAIGSIAWQAISESFGKTLTRGAATVNLRLPGQYFDQETQSHYNYFRDYEGETGRYLQKDPAGTRGGINLYGYVQQNPLIGVDPRGLAAYYGLWCGDDWTGGRRHPYEPKPEGYYREPLDALDELCKKHDIAYYNCRKQFPCNQTEKFNCMKTANAVLNSEAGALALAGNNFGAFEISMAMLLDPKPEPNDANCPTCINPVISNYPVVPTGPAPFLTQMQ